MSMEKETVNDGLEQKTDDVTVETATEQKDAAAAASAEQGSRSLAESISGFDFRCANMFMIISS